MNLIFHILLSVLLGLAFYQDWKFRAISWLVFPLITIVALLIFLQPGGAWSNLGSNLTFVIVVISSLFIYVSMREKKLTNIFENHFGIGDALFFIAISPLFGSSNFILFFISGMILSGTFHLIILKRVNQKTIPLAGYLAVYVMLLQCSVGLSGIDVFTRNFIQ